jgi:hypothetical protein
MPGKTVLVVLMAVLVMIAGYHSLHPRRILLTGTPSADDPILQEVYALRNAISVECNVDTAKILDRLARSNGQRPSPRDDPTCYAKTRL